MAQLRAAPRPTVLIAALAALAAFPATASATLGEFADAPTSPEAAGSEANDLVAGDLMGGPQQDLAIAGDDGLLTVLVGSAGGDFGEHANSPYPVVGTPQSITAGQFSADAIPDLALGSGTGTSVSIFLGNTFGVFTEPGTSPETAGSNPSDVAVGNFNGDANADLAVTNRGSDNVTILLGAGAGDFTEKADTSPETAGDGAESIVVGNFNADANQDLAVANANAGNVTILLGDGTGDFTGSSEATGGAADLAVGTFDANATEDLAVTTGSNNAVAILLGNGAGGFTAAATSPEPAGFAPRALAVGQLDGDSEEDIAVVNANSNDMTVLLGDGTGDFSEPPTSPHSLGLTSTAIVAADFDGDAATDLAVADFGGTVSILLNDPASFERTLSLRYKKSKRDFKGKVEADAAGCVEGSTVTVFKKRNGDDLEIGSDESAASGKYKLHRHAGPGRYYADVAQSTELGALCYAGRSPTLKLR